MNKRWRAARAAFLTAVLCAAALIFSSAAAAKPYLGDYSTLMSIEADPPLTSLASVPLTTPSGTIQSVVYDGANSAVNAAQTLPQTLSGFTVPAAPFNAKTTAVVADGQVAGNSFHFNGSGPALNDPNAFPGTGPCPAGWSFGCLWDNRDYDVTSTLAPGDSSANLSVVTGNDCVTWVAQVFATGPSAAFANAGYVSAGRSLRDQGSGALNFVGIPTGSYIARAYLFRGIINPVEAGGVMMIDGHGTASHLDGTSLSPCWPSAGSTQSIFDYSANVT